MKIRVRKGLMTKLPFGKKEGNPVETIYAATSECEPRFINDCKATSGEPSIAFVHPEDGAVEMSLVNIYDYFKSIDVIEDITAPNPPTNLITNSMMWLSSSGFRVEFTAGNDTGTLRGHKIYFGTTANNLVEIAEVPAGTNQYSIAGLIANTTYYVAVRAVDNASNLSTALTGSQTTLAVGQITGLTEGVVTTTTIPVTWTDINFGFGPNNLDYYSLRIALDGQTPVEVAQIAYGVQAYTFTGLTTATAYDIAVVSVDTVGNESAPVTLDSTTA